MDINEASKFFKNLITETEDRSEEKIYKKFVNILSQLENRDLSEEQLDGIQNKLDDVSIDVKREERKKYFKGKLSEFCSYIRKELSLLSSEHYMTIGMSIGMCLGMSVGMIFGVVFGANTDQSKSLVYGMSFGMPIGMSIGLAIGAAMDLKAKKEGRVLDTKLDYLKK
ncbi:hypothetical protein [Aquimarina litoralis]|uniref:hypothetical protein n=1 Tax=Aquimarina litoralis TaxID=584605 RepID=UPI001C56C2C6|nr:hypothetical protein [Aquimarina litoralis]MBW1295548.1 hypothetical protein [Aquimarina litoralis]